MVNNDVTEEGDSSIYTQATNNSRKVARASTRVVKSNLRFLTSSIRFPDEWHVCIIVMGRLFTYRRHDWFRKCCFWRVLLAVCDLH